MALNLFLLALFGCLWRMGGSHKYNKLFRRLGCPSIFLIKILLNFSWIKLISVPFLLIVLTSGYGESSWLANKLKNSYLVRFSCGLFYSLTSLFMLWGNIYLILLNIVFVSILVMLLGNGIFKLKDVKEEFFIGIVVGLIPLLN